MKGGDEVECEFCSKLLGMLKNKQKPFDKLSNEEIENNIYLITLRGKEAKGYGRGFKLCNSCMKTIKKDNKYRIKQGLEIPNNLDTLRITNGDF